MDKTSKPYPTRLVSNLTEEDIRLSKITCSGPDDPNAPPPLEIDPTPEELETFDEDCITMGVALRLPVH